MEETLELRLYEERAQALVGDAGSRDRSGTVRKIKMSPADPAVGRIKAAQAEAHLRGQSVFSYWNLKRTYSPTELIAAELVQLLPNAMFEPAGEECGTEYDYSRGCGTCGAGRQQMSELKIQASRIPRSADLAFSISRDEFVVSERLRDLIASEGLTGAALLPVWSGRGHGVLSEGWSQMAFSSQPVDAIEPTTFGDWPSDEPVGACPLGHVAGLRILSELHMSRSSWDGSDFVRTKQLVGRRGGLLVPYPLLLVSRRCYHLLREGGFKGFSPEVAHVV